MIVIEPFDVSRSSDTFGADPVVLPNKTPDTRLLVFSVKSRSLSLNLMKPFDVLASNRIGIRSDKFNLIAPLLVSNLHFPSSVQPISWMLPLLESACILPVEFSMMILPLLVESRRDPVAPLTSIFPFDVLMVTGPWLWLVETLPLEVSNFKGQLAGTFSSRLTESENMMA